MKYIETDFLHISIMDDRTALVEAVYGVEIDLEKSKYANELIEKEMPGDYGTIIDRKADYSIVPGPVYDVLNALEKLKAIAIVVHNKKNFLPESMEKSMYKEKLGMFNSIKKALEWMASVLNSLR